ncbi:MAG: hypothetical protein GTN36_06190 [Candidatus Aenigmarchaeota archaeon]|nr:hypothetical protein [Candidatus Aenigmarchaeota archaeon]
MVLLNGVIMPYIPNFFQFFLMLFMIFFLFFGLGVGSIIAFTIIGLIGGLFGLLFFNRKVIMFPNPKIAIFIGYVGFILVFLILPLLLAILPEIISYSSSSYSGFTPMTLLLTFFSLPLIHCVVSIGFYILLENRKAFNSNYFAFITAYFLACLVLAPFTVFVGFLGLLGGFGSVFSSVSSIL